MLTELTLLGAEEAAIHAINWLKLMIEAVGALVIGMGLVAALASWSRGMRVRSRDMFSETRLTLESYLDLAL